MCLAMAVPSIAHKIENSVEKQSVGVVRIGMPVEDSMKFFVRSRFIPCRTVKGKQTGRINMRKRSLKKQSSTAANGYLPHRNYHLKHE